jgi:hypothetical protein
MDCELLTPEDDPAALAARLRATVARPRSLPASPPLARAEGFEVHARSMEARIRDNGGSR